MDRVRNFFVRAPPNAANSDETQEDIKEQERTRMEALDAATIARLATVLVSEVQSALKRADPNNKEYAESWADELLDVFKAQSTHEGSLLSLRKNRFFSMKCVEAELHIHLIYGFTALKVISEKFLDKDPSEVAHIMKELLLSTLFSRSDEGAGALDTIPRPQLLNLLSLSVSRYNHKGVAVQREVKAVIEEIFNSDRGGGLSNSLMWYLHEKTTINHLTHDLASLVLEDLEANSIGSSTALCVDEVWVQGLLVIVAVLVDSCKHGSALLEDFEKANGYVIFTEILQHCTAKSMPLLLNAVVALTFAPTQQNTSRSRSMSASSESSQPGSDRVANFTSFKLLQRLLLFKNPSLAKCMEEKDQSLDTLSQSEFANRVMIAVKKCAKLSMSQGHHQTDDEVCQWILDTVLQVYSRHPDNCSLLEPMYHMLGLFFAGLNSFRSSEVKHMIHSTLEFVSIGSSGEVPIHALQAVSLTFLGLCEATLEAAPESDEVGFNTVLEDTKCVKNTLVRLVSFDHSLGEILCSCGLMATVILPLLKTVELKGLEMVAMTEQSSGHMIATGGLHVGVMCCLLLDELLASPSNVQRFRDLKIHEVLVAITRTLDRQSTSAALKVLGTIAALHSNAKQLKANMMSLSDTILVKGVWRQCEVFNTIRSIFTLNTTSKDVWRNIGGFEMCMMTLKSFKDAFTSLSSDHVFETVRSILLCLLEALRGEGEADSFEHVANRQHMRSIGYTVLAQYLVDSGIFRSNDSAKYDVKLLHLLFCLIAGGYLPTEDGWGDFKGNDPLSISVIEDASETSFRPPTIVNADAALLLLDHKLIESLPEDWATTVISQVSTLALNGGAAAFHRLSHAGVMSYLCTMSCRLSKGSSQSSLDHEVQKLISLIGTASMDVTDLSSSLIGLAGSMVENQAPQYNKFDMMANMTERRARDKIENKHSVSLKTLLSLANGGQSESCAHLGSQTLSDVMPSGQDIADAFAHEVKVHTESEVAPSKILSKVASQTGMNILTVDDTEQVWNAHTSYSLVLWFKYEAPHFAARSPRSPSPPTPAPQPLLVDKDGSPLLHCRTFSDSEDDEASTEGVTPTERLCLWSAQSLQTTGGFIYLFFEIQTKCFYVESAQTSHPQSRRDVKQVAAFTCSVMEPECWFNLTLVHVRTKRMLGSTESVTLFLNGQSLGVAKLDTPRLENPVLQVFGCPPPAILHVYSIPSTKPSPPPPPATSPSLSSVVRGRGMSAAKKGVCLQEVGRRSPQLVTYPRWDLGPVRVISEVISSHGALSIYALGPSYSGNFRGGILPESVLSVVLLSRLSRIDHATDEDISHMLSYPVSALPHSPTGNSSSLQSSPSPPFKRWDAAKVRHESLLSKLHFDESFKITEERKERMDANMNIPSSNDKFLQANDLDDMNLGVNSFTVGAESILFSLRMECTKQSVDMSVPWNEYIAHISDPWKLGSANIYSNSLHLYRLQATSDLITQPLSDVVLHGAYDALVQKSTMPRIVHGSSSITAIFPLVANSQSPASLAEVLKVLLGLVHGHQGNLEYMHKEGYTVLASLLYHKFHLFSDVVVDILFQFAILVFNVNDAVHDIEEIDNNCLLLEKGNSWLLVDLFALKLLLLNTQLWLGKVKRNDEKAVAFIQPLLHLFKLFSRLLSSESRYAKTNCTRLLCEPLNFVAYVIHALIEVESILSTPNASPQISANKSPQQTPKALSEEVLLKQKNFLLDVFTVGSELLTILFWKSASNRDCFLLAQTVIGTPLSENQSTKRSDELATNTSIQVHMLDLIFRITTSDPCCSIPCSHGAVPLCIDLLVKCLTPEWFAAAVKASASNSISAGLLLRLGCRLLQKHTVVDVRSLGITAVLKDLSQHRVTASLIIPAFFMMSGCDILHCPWNNESHQDQLRMKSMDDFWAIIETSIQKSANLEENEKKDSLGNVEELCFCGFSLLMDMLQKLWRREELQEGDFFIDTNNVSEYSAFTVELVTRCIVQLPKVNRSVRSKRFLKVLIELLFVCMDHTNIKAEKEGRSSDNVGVGTVVGGRTDDGHSRSAELSVLSDPGLFCGEHGLSLFPMFEGMLVNALIESSQLSTFLNNLFSAIPKKEVSMLLTYEGFVLKMITAALPLALNKPSETLFVNTTVVSKIILEHTIRGVFTTATIEVALEIALSVVRAVCGNKAAVILESKQRQLIAEAVFSAHHLVIIALHRCSVNGTASASVISLVRKHSSLLLQRSFAGAATAGLMNSTTTERDLSKTSAFQMSHQDTDELLVVNLLGECLALLTCKDEAIKQDLLHIMSTVLKQRRTYARELLMPESSKNNDDFIDMTDGLDLLTQSSNRNNDFMAWLAESPQKEAVRKALERATYQSQTANPKLASELPGVAVATLQANNVTSFPSNLTSQTSHSKSSLTMSSSSIKLSVPSPMEQFVLSTLHAHWKIGGSEFISRGEATYPVLIHRMSGLSIWEGKTDSTVERFWKLLNHQGPDGARRRLVVNHEFHQNFAPHETSDGTLVYIPISQKKAVSFKVNKSDSDSNASSKDGEESITRSDSLVDNDTLSFENLKRITRRSMTMSRKERDDSYDEEEDDDESGDVLLSSPEASAVAASLDMMPPLSLKSESFEKEGSQKENEEMVSDFDSSQELTEELVGPAALSKGAGAHEVAILKGVFKSTDWPPIRCFNIKIVSGLDTTRSALLCVSAHAIAIVEGFQSPPQSVALEKGAFRVNKDTGSAYEVTPPLELPYSTLLVVYKRRHQLRPVALEFFNDDGSSVLTAFESEQDSEEMLGRIMSAELPRSLFAKYSGSGGVPQMSKVSFASMRLFGKNKYKSFITAHRKHMTRKWQSGELSNFEYLMHLNTLAGRSFHDLTQYPVMPWVIADYESKVLDLNSPTTFRDLSQPMGALGAARAAQFKERYESLDELREGDESSIRPFHYGTHYSCAGYVLYYLVRLEPFSRLALQLQGGRFDKPDRLFRDVAASWKSASSENIQDVRELIPEFFSLPEFLSNANRFDFGDPQKGPKIWDVKLPPWARDDPHEFVRMQRAALESRYVSERLHLWIDLIFGCKQRGPEAIKAQNVFVHITYENEVDLDAIEDPLERDATLSQIQNFGQTPSRLFAKRPHPARVVPEIVKLVDPSTGSTVVNAVGVLAGSKSTRPLEPSTSLSSSSSPSQALQQLLSDPNKPYTVVVDSNAVSWHKGLSPPLCVIGATHRTSLHCTHVSSLADHTHHAPFPINSSNASALVHYIHNGGDGGGAVGDINFAEEAGSSHSRKIICAKRRSVVVPAVAIKKKLLTFSIHDCGIAVSGREKDYQVFENLHLSPVKSLTSSSDGSIVVTGGSDAIIHVWLFSKISSQKSLSMSAANQVTSAVGRTVKSTSRFELELKGTLNGHKCAVHLLDLSMVQGVLVSGSVDGRVVVWDIETCSYLHDLQHHHPPLKALSISPTTGDVVTLSGNELRMWSNSGKLRALTNLLNPGVNEVEYNDYMSNASTCCATGNAQWCLYEGVCVAMGHESGMLSLWRLKRWKHDAALPDEFELCSSLPAEVHQERITCIKVASRGQEMLVGDQSGLISRWSAPRLDSVNSDEALALLLKD